MYNWLPISIYCAYKKLLTDPSYSPVNNLNDAGTATPVELSL